MVPTALAADAAALEAAAKAVDARAIEWRRDLHQHPELGNREVRTAGIVAAHLRKLGMEVEEKIAHTGVTGLLKGGKPGPLIALRADMDALPVVEQGDLPFKSVAKAEFGGEQVGVMHACGHDAHVAILMGVAEVLAGMREDLAGSILFIFQPAEEGAPEGEEGGAELMLKQGLFERHKPEAIFGLHVFSQWNAGKIAIRSGPVMAESDRFRIVVKGRQTHGSKPWTGVDPIVTAAQIVNALQTIVSRRVELTSTPAVVTVGAFRGGNRYNIIPESVEMIGTVRSFEIPVRDAIWADVKRIAEHTATAAGATAEVEFWRKTSVTANDPALTKRMRPSLEAAVGAEDIVDMNLTTVAEDFAEFSNVVPGMYFFVGSTPQGQDPATAPANHSPLFFVDESAIGIGIRAMSRVAADYLAAP